MHPTVKKSKCKVTFDSLLKKVNENAKVLDFAKIKKTFSKYHIFLLATNRGSFGKTTGSKILALQEWKENGKPSLFLKNTKAQIEDEYGKFANPEVVKVIPEFANIKPGYLTFNLDNKRLFDMQAVNNYDAMKGTRVSYNNIFYDEINEKAQYIRKGQVISFLNSILASTDNQVANAGKIRDDYLWLMCNYKDMNNLVLLSLGIQDLTEQVATYNLVYDDMQVPFLVVIRCSYTLAEKNAFIKKNLKNDWRLAFGLASGDIEHSYFNEAYEQTENWNVVKEQDIRHFLTSAQIKIKAENGEYIYFSKIANYHIRTLHIWLASLKAYRPDNYYREFNLDLKKIRENQHFDFALKNELYNKIATNKMYFDSIKTRTLFLNMLK